MMLLVGLIAVAVLVALDRRGQHAVPIGDRTHPRIGHPASHRHDPRPAAGAHSPSKRCSSPLVSGILPAYYLAHCSAGWAHTWCSVMYGTVVFPFEWGINGIVLAVAAVAALLASVRARPPRGQACRRLRRSRKPKLHSNYNEKDSCYGHGRSPFLRTMHTSKRQVNQTRWFS